MFEFITVRELYEMFLSNQMMDLEGYEYVDLRDGFELIVTMGNWDLLL